MIRPTATVRINTAYTTPRIGLQYARNLKSALDSEFPDWNIEVIPGTADEVVLPIEDGLDHFRTEFCVRALMTEALMKAVNDCDNNLDKPAQA